MLLVEIYFISHADHVILFMPAMSENNMPNKDSNLRRDVSLVFKIFDDVCIFAPFSHLYALLSHPSALKLLAP